MLSVAVLAAAALVTLTTFASTTLGTANQRSVTIVRDEATPALDASKASRAWATFRRLTLRELMSASDSTAQTDATAGLVQQQDLVTALLDDYATAALTADQRTALERVRSEL